MVQSVKRVGLEKEVWILDKQGRIVEPKLYGFPHDDFGFLIEIRSSPQSNVEWLLKDMDNQTAKINRKAYKNGLRVVDVHQMPIDRELIKCLSEKYHYDKILDLTSNVYPGVVKSHATGIMGDVLTAGLHVHFSDMNTEKLYEVIPLPIESIVKAMDERFRESIVTAGRILGEWEPKRYGFEYRSLPSTANIKDVAYHALNVLGVVEGLV